MVLYYIKKVRMIDPKTYKMFLDWYKVKYGCDEIIYRDILLKYDRLLEGGAVNVANPPLTLIECRILHKFYQRWKKGSNAIWITLSPDKIRHPEWTYDEARLQQIKRFCRKWFTLIRYNYYAYVIEVGKNRDAPHLHVHALVQLKHKGQGKNHSRELKTYWNECTSTPLQGDDYYSKNVNGDILIDKLKYMDNNTKDSHENFMDVEDGKDSRGKLEE